jgi:methylenetetrahydrofolate dehydrogenase (NADP+)/methenyltetrahydrofolate cyclohydrolase
VSFLLIDGKVRSQEIQEEIRAKVELLVPCLHRKPKLAVVLVGDNPASQVYVKSKSKQAHACGMETVDVRLPASVSKDELHKELRSLGQDLTVDGILLQLPLPKGLDEFAALQCIPPKMDVDGLHPVNQGLLQRGTRSFRPCTPLGIIDLILWARKRLGFDASLAGLEAVVVGRSILVGKPVASMLTELNCTVTLCHSKTKDLVDHCQRADVLVAAIGRPEYINGECIKAGAIVIDVGINRLSDGRLVGDVDFDAAKDKAAAITPVPGGVGPMTIAMLLQNTFESAQSKVQF